MDDSRSLLSLLLFFSIPGLTQTTQLPDQFFYGGFKGITNRNLSLDGVAHILPRGILQLTNQDRRVIGHAFHASPFRFKTSPRGPAASFSTTFVFAIVPEFRQLGGHGLAFTISPTPNLSSPLPSQFLGLLNTTNNGDPSNHLFAVEFDTAMDIELRDIDNNHVGVDVNGLVSYHSVPAAYYPDGAPAKRNLSLNSGIKFQAWIDYDSPAAVLNVTLSPSSSKPRLPTLSCKLDLSPVFRERMYVGFSASTGVLASSHDVFGWSFRVGGGEAPALDLSSLPSLPGRRKKHTALILGVGVSSALLVVFAIGTAIYLAVRIKNADVIEDWERQIEPHRFPYEELKRATKGFGDRELLGHGGFGRVYKGTLPNSGARVAVKRISQGSNQGIREFVAEIDCFGRLRHRNLVPLRGWCRRRSDLILVYDFMENGSLDRYLFDNPARILTWEERFSVIDGVAAALLYLHEGSEQVVIHRDVKASNVLLDGELNARLGDFGLARLADRGENPSTTRVVGTLGYLAPEIPRTGRVTAGSDVFAFGALLLEVACGRRPVEPSFRPDEVVLVDWVRDKWRVGRIEEAVDPRLDGRYDAAEAETVLKLGVMCSGEAAAGRPGMKEVVRILKGETRMPEALGQPLGMPEAGKGLSTTSFLKEGIRSFASTANGGDAGRGSASFRTSRISRSTSTLPAE